MSQHDYVIANDTAANVRSDINSALLAIASNNSGATAPATTYANQWWYDSTNDILKIRSEANDAWISVATLNQTSKQFFPIVGGVAVTATGTEMNYLVGVSSAIQTQLGAKAPLASPAFTGNTTATGTVSDQAGDIRDLVNSSKTATYVPAATDNGKLINITTGGITINTGVFAAGQNVTIYNNSASSQTITQGSGVTMYLAGTATTGNRTLAQRGIATILCVASNTFVCSGAGVT